MFGLGRCISAAKVTNLFTTTGYLTPATLPCLKFLSTEKYSNKKHGRSRNIFIRSKVFLETSEDLGILKEVCGTDYIPKIHFRGKSSILVELRSAEEVKLLVGNGEERQVKIGDQIFWMDPPRTREHAAERYTDRCSKRVVIQGILESTSDDEEENKEHSLKAVENMLSHLGSKCQVDFVRPMGKKMANRQRLVQVDFTAQEEAQSLLNDGKEKTFKIGEQMLYIRPYVPLKNSSNESDRSRKY